MLRNNVKIKNAPSINLFYNAHRVINGSNYRNAGNGQAGSHALCLIPAMPINLEELARKNLLRIIEERELKQVEVAARIGTTPQHLNAILRGDRGLGSDIMTRLCREFKIDPWEFYWTEKTPIVRDAKEMADLERRREAEKVGIAEMVREAEEGWIVAAKKKSGLVREDAKARSKRTHKRAG